MHEITNEMYAAWARAHASSMVDNERHRCAQMVRDAIVILPTTPEEMEEWLQSLADAIEGK
jgi:truncated hemoglobin YjbI